MLTMRSMLVLSAIYFAGSCVLALPVFDAELAASPFVHDSRLNYYQKRSFEGPSNPLEMNKLLGMADVNDYPM